MNFFRRAKFWNKLSFQKSNTPHYLLFVGATFLERLLFQKTLPSVTATFSEELLFLQTHLFRKVTISKLRVLSTATLHIYQLVIKWSKCYLCAVKVYISWDISCVSITGQSRILGKFLLLVDYTKYCGIANFWLRLFLSKFLF